MATNKYFRNFNTRNEQLLIEDLVIETIKIHGIDMYYIPRELFLDQPSILFGDDPISKFREHFIIEMYIKTVNGFEGEGDVISKFGLEIKDTASFVVSRKRFEHVTNRSRPFEGDLIYFPLTESFFEIKFVEDENPFYQLGRNYTYDLSVELFQYSHEDIKTQIPEIDSIVDSVKFKNILSIDSVVGTFAKGDSVFSLADGASFGSIEDSIARGTVVAYDSVRETLEIEKTVGKWLSSSPSKVFHAIGQNGSYARIVSVGNTTDKNPANDNQLLEFDAGNLLDFSEFNPFKDMF
jgi:hypothetical protein